MSDINPYNCTIPGRLFVGFEKLRQEFLTGFRNGNSYAILGGRRCGKTSLLLQIEKDLQVKPDVLPSFHLLPRYLDIQQFNELTPGILFESIYDLVVQEIDAPTWDEGKPGREYQTFLKQLDKAKPVLDNQYGTDWLVVLLIDEMDGALKKLPDDQFFQNLRNLLMVSRFNRHFRVVAAGVKDMSKLIFSGSSPLNNLLHEYLRVLNGDEIDELIQAGFEKQLNTKILFQLIQLTGGHPYLLQGILEKLWQSASETLALPGRKPTPSPSQEGNAGKMPALPGVDKNAVKQAAEKFLSQHSDFDHWLNYFSLPEHVVYQRLSAAKDGTLHIRDLREGMNSSIAAKIDDAITVLGYHGVIDDSDPDEPQIAGTMFRDWYQENCSIPHVEEVLKGFESLKAEVAQLSVDESTKKEVQEALEQGIQEIKKPDSEGQPTKEVLKASLEKAGGSFKAAGTTAESIGTFIEKVKPLATLLGTGAGWLIANWPF